MRFRRDIIPLIIGLIATLFIPLTFRNSGILRNLEWRTYDFRLNQVERKLRPGKGRESREVSSDIIIVSIDRESIKNLGRWPWPRRYLAQFIDQLMKAKPKAIFIDLPFVEQDREKPLNDRKLIEATRKAGTIYYDYLFTREEIYGDILTTMLKEKAGRELTSRFSLELKEGKGETGEWAKGIAPPLPELCASAKGVGVANVESEEDGVVRRIPLIIKYRGRYYPAISLLMAADYKGVKRKEIRITPGRGINLRDTSIPIDEGGRMLIKFLGKRETFPNYSFYRLRRGDLPLYLFKDKLILVGFIKSGLGECYRTPVGELASIEFQANVLNAILLKRFIFQASPALYIGILILLGLFLGVIFPRLKFFSNTTIFFLILVTYSALSFILFWWRSIWLNLAQPLLGLTFAFICLNLYYYLTEGRERRVVKANLKRHLAPLMIKEIFGLPGKIEIKAEKREITLLSLELKGFAAIMEKMEPKGIVEILKEYHTVMAEIIFNFGGTLDRFSGPSLLAFYGAPTLQIDHVERAIEAALRIQEEGKRLSDKWGNRGGLIGIGIDTGEVIVGDLGSEGRFDYSALGRAVDTASQLREVTKGGQILVSEYTYARVKDMVEVREVDPLSLKGWRGIVPIYEILGLKKGRS